MNLIFQKQENLLLILQRKRKPVGCNKYFLRIAPYVANLPSSSFLHIRRNAQTPLIAPYN
jgi:hypothetical protein